ncbi:hypothetical protein GCM10009682_63930 [Luedemannella flava]|uniref:NTP pyrophosphohydrolase n=1 Tax=Luedemannella flava TaxID=349316 RepID=A0ABP4Z3F7_9ACTN
MTVLLVVDAASVVGSVPDGWWRDRAGAATRLRDAFAPVAADGLPAPASAPAIPGPVEVVLVVEGQARGVPTIPGVRVVAAPGSGDDAIVDLVAGLDPHRDCIVVTADRGLLDRLDRYGVRVRGPRSIPRRML